MKSIRRVRIWVLVTVIVLAGALDARAVAGGQAKTDPKVVAKLAQIMEQSGYTYRKASDNVWVVDFKGKSLPEMSVFVTSAEDLIVIGAVVAPKKSMKVTPELMFKLLKLANDIDRVKIGFDDDDDLFVRAEITARIFDVDAFKSAIEQVAAGTDKVHAAIKTYLVK